MDSIRRQATHTQTFPAFPSAAKLFATPAKWSAAATALTTLGSPMYTREGSWDAAWHQNTLAAFETAMLKAKFVPGMK
eukprot:1158402-Pelagomonas_calceolata.AAC.5